MKKREIFLDFTALLDVILVILFFFIMYTNFDISKSRSEMEKATEDMNTLAEEYKEKIAEAENMTAEAVLREKEAAESLQELLDARDRTGENYNGIIDFSKGINLRILLLKQNNDDNWSLEIYKGETSLGIINNSSTEVMQKNLSDIISENKYTKEDTILCEFIYNAGINGTAGAYRKTKNLIKDLQKEYKFFYFSEIDTSLYKGEQ